MRAALRRLGLRWKIAALGAALPAAAAAALAQDQLPGGSWSARLVVTVLGWVGLGGGIGWWLGGRVSRPLGRLASVLSDGGGRLADVAWSEAAEGEIGLVAERLVARERDLEGERRRAEARVGALAGEVERARAERERLAGQHLAILDTVRDGIVLVAGDDRVVLANPAARELLGPGLAPGSPLGAAVGDREALGRLLGFARGRRRPVQALTRAGEPAGGRRLRLRATAVAGGAEVVVVAEDLSESERLEEQMLRSESLAALGTLSAGLAHQLGNHLNAIRGHARLVRRRAGDDAEALRDLEVIEREVRTASALMEKVTLVARTRPPAPAPLHVPTVLSEVVDAVRPECERRRIAIDARLASPGCVSSGDPHLFQQAVLNVVVNAVQAMDRGGTLTVTTGCGRDRHCLVTVADTGPGIPAALQRKVFDPFFTTKPEGEGTGLGLAIAHRILELHGATIRVESEPGRGAAFHIDLPLGSEAEAGCGAGCCSRD